MKRRLAAILAADVVGYSHLMNGDEMGTLKALKQCEAEIIEPTVEKYHGRIFKRMGDGFFVEFASAVDSIDCALAWQKQTTDKNQLLKFRIGINLGDVIAQGDDMFGDCVNIAARVEKLADAGGICISQDIFNQIRKKVSLGFEYIGEQQVKNISEPIGVYNVLTNLEDAGRITGEDTPIVSHDQTVSLAILPFEGGSENEDRAHLVSGFVEDLIIELSGYSDLQIISSYTANLLDDSDVDIFEAAQEISIGYLLKGSIRFTNDTLRISTQLLNTSTRKVLWAERNDAPIKSFFDIQDSVVEKIVFTIQSEVGLDLLKIARLKPTTRLEIHDCWLRGMAKLREGTLDSDQNAREFFEQALTIDPNYARAYAGLSLSHFNEWSCQLWELFEESEGLAHHYALQATLLGDADHVVHMILGRVYTYRRQFHEAEFHIDRSLELNRSDADNLIQLATCMAFHGRVADGENLIEKALKINPYRSIWYYQYGALVYFVKRDYQHFIDMALKRQLTNIWVDLPGYIAAAYAYLGDMDQARVFLQMFIKSFQASVTKGKTPTLTEIVDWLKMANPFKFESDTEHLIEGLKLAGIADKHHEQTFIPQISNQKASINASIFIKEQAIWRIQFDNKEITLTNMKGLQDINRLLQTPETELHCTDLMGSESSMDEADYAIDEKAKQAYRKHLKDLEEDIAEAEEQNDLGKTAKLKNEYDQLIDHLSKSLGTGNRSRKLKSPTERARAAVTMRIKAAIDRITTHHPPLGKHLSNSIRTGVFCTYSPEENRDWITV